MGLSSSCSSSFVIDSYSSTSTPIPPTSTTTITTSSVTNEKWCSLDDALSSNLCVLVQSIVCE